MGGWKKSGEKEGYGLWNKQVQNEHPVEGCEHTDRSEHLETAFYRDAVETTGVWF